MIVLLRVENYVDKLTKTLFVYYQNIGKVTITIRKNPYG